MAYENENKLRMGEHMGIRVEDARGTKRTKREMEQTLRRGDAFKAIMMGEGNCTMKRLHKSRHKRIKGQMSEKKKETGQKSTRKLRRRGCCCMNTKLGTSGTTLKNFFGLLNLCVRVWL